MPKPFNPMAAWANMMQIGKMAAEAQMIIGMRLLGQQGFWSLSPTENARMVSEKTYAFTKSATDSTRAALMGKSPDEIMAAAIKPVRNKTRANAKRLAKRGPRKGISYAR